MIISDAELNNALMKELISGRQLMESRQQIRERAAAMEAQSYKGCKATPGFGTHVAEIPEHECHLLIQKYGYEEVHSKGFLRDYQRLEPSMASNKI